MKTPLLFASVALVAVVLGSATAVQAQHYESERDSRGYGQSSYHGSGHGQYGQQHQHYQPPVRRYGEGPVHVDRYGRAHIHHNRHVDRLPPVHVDRHGHVHVHHNGHVHQLPPVPPVHVHRHGHRSHR